MDAQGTDAPDPCAAARDARAGRYFRRDLDGQREWYDDHASAYSRRAQWLGLFVIAAGAATAVLQAFGAAPWVSVTTALLGGLVAVAEGWQRTARYAERWRAYRVASERMKRERRLYANGAGEYRSIGDDEEGAFLRFVENVEAIIAEEQQIYWSRGNDSPAHPVAAGGTTGAGGKRGEQT